MTKILILGGGFAGIAAALRLSKKLQHKDAEITLISNRDVHVYNADLYEIATAFNKKITEECLTKLKETVAIPLEKIFENLPVQIIKDEIIKIDPVKKEVHIKEKGTHSYDYLIIALGSVTNYYDIPDLRQFAYPLKKLEDALAISCHIDSYFHNLWKKEQKKKISIVVGGGGFTGVEFACELPGFLKRICKKYNYPRKNVEISLIQGGEELIGQGKEISDIAQKRLQKFGIKIFLNSKIKKVDINHVQVETLLEMDMLIWTGGVMPNPLIRENFTKVEKNGALPVNGFLQSIEFPDIYAAGDCASTQDKAPMLAQVACDEGQIIADNIIAEIRHTEKKKYNFHLKGIIIPLGGKYAIFKTEKYIFKGFWVWILRRLVDLKYTLSILPWFYGLKKWLRSTSIFAEND